MALGGGVFVTQNKVLPGSYINFVSAMRADAELSDRGVAAMPLELSWGPDGTVFSVTAEEFRKNAKEIFGYDSTAEEMRNLRELFSNIRMGYFYKLNTGEKAANSLAVAKYAGSRGNDLSVSVQSSGDGFLVETLLEGKAVDAQTVKDMEELLDNGYVTFTREGELTAAAATPLTGGTDGDDVTAEEYTAFFNSIEPYSFNVLGCPTLLEEVNSLAADFTKRMREDNGVKFQTVLYQYDADYEGVINVWNSSLTGKECDLVYWVTGAEAGCQVNAGNTNRVYDGELEVEADLTQTQLESGLLAGRFLFHRSGDDVRVLEDQNSLTTLTADKGEDFRNNQVIRVLDQIGNDIAVLFCEKYLGKVPNDNAGRISLWNDVVRHHQELEALRAIEGFSSDHVSVEAGDTKKSVVVIDAVQPVSAMAQLYMTVTVQ